LKLVETTLERQGGGGGGTRKESLEIKGVTGVRMVLEGKRNIENSQEEKRL